ncbi:hypothetical protein [Oleiharenicola lentus]|uniref:hypothetical protein n=1 Tax=Oleiharenicola lentus TaxID=2508720 RepID=UPI003F6778B4
MDKLFYKDFAARPYWQLKDGTTKIDSRERVMTYLEATRFEARYLLSPELFSVNKEMIEGLRTRYGAIPEEKLRLLALADTERNIKQQEKYLAKKREVSKPGENQYASSEASWETQQQEHLNTIKSILSPEEFKVYELSSSPLAREQRERLNAFRPSEEEYKVVMALEAQLQAARKNPNLTTEERQRLRPDTDAAVAAALGDERGADYLALRKYNGEPIVYLMARLDLPLATITAVDVVREHSLAQAKTIQANSQLTPAERTAQLAALSRETQSQLTHTLGERGVTAYRDISGDWLGNLDKPASGKP